MSFQRYQINWGSTALLAGEVTCGAARKWSCRLKEFEGKKVLNRNRNWKLNDAGAAHQCEPDSVCRMSCVPPPLYAFTKLRKATISFVMSCLSAFLSTCKNTVYPERIFVTFIFEYFSKICSENLNFIEIGQVQQVLYVKTNVHLWSYLAEFFL